MKKKGCRSVAFLILGVLFLIPYDLFCQVKSSSGGQVTIAIEPVFNGQPLKLKDHYYTDERGDTLSIEVFKFYLTDLCFFSGSSFVNDSNSHLVDAENMATTTFHVDHVSPGSYSSLRFVVGVDSIANTSGANGGDLDPANGMYWVWNTGYIMAKLEGKSKVCKTLHHAFEFHIGGFAPPYNAARVVTLALPQAMVIKNGSQPVIRVKADVAAWFRGKLDLSKTNSVLIPGKEACVIADNYAHMFSIDVINN